jgi:hypothetical protein
MKLKKIMTALLSIFVGVSLVYLLVGGSNPSESIPAISKNVEVMAYYFHGNMRCETCETMEAFAKETFATQFEAERVAGRLRFQVVNVDEAANTHFVEAYGLTTRSVVVARYKEGIAQEWKNLEEVWNLVDDKQAFLDYVAGETRPLLGNGEE